MKQIYCSYSLTHNIQNGFLHSLLVFVRSTLFLNRNRYIGEEFFVFYKFAFPSILLLTPALTLLRLLPVTCVLCDFTYKLSISIDMIIEIQITKLLEKLLTESHWREIFFRLKYVTHLNTSVRWGEATWPPLQALKIKKL